MATSKDNLTISDIFDVSNITPEGLEEIYLAKNRTRKREVLLEKLEINEICEETELRKSILIDFLLDVIIQTSDCGFSWSNTQNAVGFLVNLLQETSCKGKSFKDAISVFKLMIGDIKADFVATEMKALIDYTLHAFFCHYNLYLFCMTNEQQVDLREETLEVHAPNVPTSLSGGIEFEKWKYQQAIEQIRNEQDHLKTIRDEKHNSNIDRIELASEEAHDHLKAALEAQNSDEFTSIVQALTKLHVEQFDAELQRSIEESKDKIDFVMKKNNISQPNSARLRPVSQNRAKSRQKK